MISIVMAPGERGTDRHLALAEYIADHPGEYDFSFGEVEVDLVFTLRKDIFTSETRAEMQFKRRAVELKMPADFGQSLQNGHLSSQRRQCPYPLQVAVLGSLGDVLRALPEVNGLGWRNARERAQAEAMVRRGIAALKASGVDVAFGVSPLDMPPMTLVVPEEWATRRNMAQICREAKAYLEGDIRLPRPDSLREAGNAGRGPCRGDDEMAYLIDSDEARHIAEVPDEIGFCYGKAIPEDESQAWMKERRMKEDIDARDRIAELEVSELQKHIIAGKLADEAAAQKRRIAELETELLEANAKRLYAQGVAFETDEGQLEFGWSEMEEIDRARFRYMASTGATWMEAYAELSAGEEKTAPEEGRDGNK